MGFPGPAQRPGSRAPGGCFRPRQARFATGVARPDWETETKVARPGPTRGQRRGAARPPRDITGRSGNLVPTARRCQASSSCACAREESLLLSPIRMGSHFAGGRLGSRVPCLSLTAHTVWSCRRGSLVLSNPIFVGAQEGTAWHIKRKVIKVSRFSCVNPTSCNSRQ